MNILLLTAIRTVDVDLVKQLISENQQLINEKFTAAFSDLEKAYLVGKSTASTNPLQTALLTLEETDEEYTEERDDQKRKIIEYLISEATEENLNKSLWGEKNTTLHLVALFGETEYVKTILLKGANMALKNERGFTPVDVAADDETREIFKKFEKLNPSGSKIKKRTRGSIFVSRNKQSDIALAAEAARIENTNKSEIRQPTIPEFSIEQKKEEDDEPAKIIPFSENPFLKADRTTVTVATEKELLPVSRSLRNNPFFTKLLNQENSSSFKPMVEKNWRSKRSMPTWPVEQKNEKSTKEIETSDPAITTEARSTNSVPAKHLQQNGSTLKERGEDIGRASDLIKAFEVNRNSTTKTSQFKRNELGDESRVKGIFSKWQNESVPSPKTPPPQQQLQQEILKTQEKSPLPKVFLNAVSTLNLVSVSPSKSVPIENILKTWNYEKQQETIIFPKSQLNNAHKLPSPAKLMKNASPKENENLKNKEMAIGKGIMEPKPEAEGKSVAGNVQLGKSLTEKDEIVQGEKMIVGQARNVDTIATMKQPDQSKIANTPAIDKSDSACNISEDYEVNEGSMENIPLMEDVHKKQDYTLQMPEVNISTSFFDEDDGSWFSKLMSNSNVISSEDKSIIFTGTKPDEKVAVLVHPETITKEEVKEICSIPVQEKVAVKVQVSENIEKEIEIPTPTIDSPPTIVNTVELETALSIVPDKGMKNINAEPKMLEAKHVGTIKNKRVKFFTSWDGKMEQRKYISMDHISYPPEHPNSKGYFLATISKLFDVNLSHQKNHDVIVNIKYGDRVIDSVPVIVPARAKNVEVSFDFGFEYTPETSLSFEITTQIPKICPGPLSEEQKKPIPPLRGGKIMRTTMKFLGSLNRRKGLHALNLASELNDGGFNGTGSFNTRKTTTDASIFIAPRSASTNQLSDLFVDEDDKIMANKIIALGGANVEQWIPDMQPKKIYKNTCDLIAASQDELDSIFNDVGSGLLGRLDCSAMYIPYSLYIENALLPSSFTECNQAMISYEYVNNKIWAQGMLTNDNKTSLFKLIGKSLISYDPDTNEIQQKFNLNLLDFIAGPNGVELFLTDIPSLRKLALSPPKAMEKSLAPCPVEKDEIYIDYDEFIFEFKDGDLLRFRCDGDGQGCVNWLMGFCKLFLEWNDLDIPEWCLL